MYSKVRKSRPDTKNDLSALALKSYNLHKPSQSYSKVRQVKAVSPDIPEIQ